MAFEKHILATRFKNLYHLSLDMARYEKTRIMRASARTDPLKGTYFCEMVEVLS